MQKILKSALHALHCAIAKHFFDNYFFARVFAHVSSPLEHFSGGSASLTLLEEEWRQKQRQRSSRLFGGQNLFNSLPR